MILVVGSNGQLGSALTNLLERSGQNYRPVDLPEFDVTDLAKVSRAIRDMRPETVMNCAGYTDVDAAETHWRRAFNINGLGTRNLAVACADIDIPLVHMSTDFVFDGDAFEPYTILDEPNPINAYGRSKLLGERLLDATTNRYYLVRTSWMFGSGEGNFLRKLLRWAATSDVVRVVDDQIAAPTSADDLASALLTLSKTGAFGVYHFRNAGQCSRFEWARYALDQIGWSGTLKPVTSDVFDTAAKRPAYSLLDMYPIEDIGVNIPTWQEATSKWLEVNT